MTEPLAWVSFVTDPSHAVFLSYASQDAQVAERIAETLRSAGIEVFLDQSELRGGDAWDQKIRHEIQSCVLFIPVVSRHTQERLEGYFRHEWKLAIERAHHMAEQKAFLIPIVVDGTRDQEALVPDAFRSVQWTRLPNGETPPAFVERIQCLLSPVPVREPANALQDLSLRRPYSSLERSLAVAAGVAALGAAAYFLAGKFRISKPIVSPPAIAASLASATFNPPPRSIAVLPFVNLSGDPREEYFSDGVSEELVNALSQIQALRVSARTSSFSFKGKETDVRTIARRLDVGTILEGSIRRSGNTVRIEAQLIDARSGFLIWSQDYDRDLKNILALQTEIATRVAAQLRARLLGDEAAAIEAGGTRNPQAYDAYLRGLERFDGSQMTDEAGVRAALMLYDRAISLDPGYAAAYAQRARALSALARDQAYLERLDRSKSLFMQARAAAEKAVRLAPDFADGHVALGWHVLLFGYFDFQSAAREMSRAMSLAPGSVYVLRTYASFEEILGHQRAALRLMQQAVSLDPQNFDYSRDLLWILAGNHRFTDVLAEVPRVRQLRPNSYEIPLYVALAYLGMGRPQQALKVCGSRSAPLEDDDRAHCLALVYHVLGRGADAEAERKKLQALEGDPGAYDYACIYAQWGDPELALRWLRTAESLRIPDLVFLRSDWQLDPIRGAPEFKALERRLDIPL